MPKKSNAELAKHYNRTKDLSDFDEGPGIPVRTRRAVTISVRFSENEIALLRQRAEEAGVKVTSFIRAAALDVTNPIDLAELTQLAQDLEKRAHDVAVLAARGVA